MQPPVVLVFFHLPGDVDTLGPLLESARRQNASIDIRIGTTPAFLAREGIRAFFDEFGQAPFVIPDASPEHLKPLEGVRAIVTGSETTLKPHRAAHDLTLALKSRGASTYTLQHGFENVGLSYFDAVQGMEVRFAADAIFTWGHPDRLPLTTPDENRAKARAVGRPRFHHRPSEPAWPNAPEVIDVAIFENLHWHRFDDTYRCRVLDEIDRICAVHPDWRFLFKPHPQGRWLTQRFKGEKPSAANLIVADPALPEWSGITGHAVIARARRVLTTPSTIALDAAQAAKPVAVFGYGLSLPLYRPLAIIESADDLDTFLTVGDAGPGRTFTDNAILAGDAARTILEAIAADIQTGV